MSKRCPLLAFAWCQCPHKHSANTAKSSQAAHRQCLHASAVAVAGHVFHDCSRRAPLADLSLESNAGFLLADDDGVDKTFFTVHRGGEAIHHSAVGQRYVQGAFQTLVVWVLERYRLDDRVVQA